MWGVDVVSVGTGLYPHAANLGKLQVLSRLYQQVASDAPLLQYMSEPWQLPKLRDSIAARTGEAVEASKFLRLGGYGLSLAGGAVEGYGEAQKYGIARGAAVGAADAGLNVASGYAGAAIAAGTTSVLGGLAAGAEEGSLLGSFGGPAGTVAGAVVGGLVGAGIAYLGGNGLEEAFNHLF
jgi:hypothetical protein